MRSTSVSGDGARFTSSSSFILLSSLPGTASNVLFGAAKQSRKVTLRFILWDYLYLWFYTNVQVITLAAIKGSENYPILSSLMNILKETNSLLDDPYIASSGERMKLQSLLGGDLKVCGVPLTNFEALQ